jgi:hypothetical protein
MRSGFLLFPLEPEIAVRVTRSAVDTAGLIWITDAMHRMV